MIRLTKTRMALLHELRKMLNDVEGGIVTPAGEDYDILKTLQARAELIDAIFDLEELGRDRAEEFLRQMLLAKHAGQKPVVLSDEELKVVRETIRTSKAVIPPTG
jgi:hypothetical protein